MQLRPYQSQILQMIRSSMSLKEKGAVVKLATGAGKTAIFCTILAGYHRANRPAMMLVRGVKLVEQASERLTAMGVPHDIWQGSATVRSGNKVIIASVDTLVARCMPKEGKKVEDLPPAEMVVVDECFSGDCEILTPLGFVRFDQLTGNETVAQFDQRDRSLSFVEPIRFVKKKVENHKMTRVFSDKNIDLLTTENHDFLLERQDGRFFKTEAKNVKGANFIHTSGLASGGDSFLTYDEKLAIAYQADGSDHSLRCAHFSFSKSNKIKEFLDLMEKGKFSFKEISGRDAIGNTKAKRRFSVRMTFLKTKNLWEVFDLNSLSLSKCRAIIEYMSIWDGHVKSANQVYFSSIDERNVDFYQSVAILSGYYARKTKQVDDRKETYSDVHRLFISKNKSKISTQGIKKEEYLHTGYVYCVTVPQGNIVVRRNGKVAICGNCHLARSPGFDWVISCYPSAYLAGFSATPNHQRGFEDIADRIISPIGIKDLIEQGYLVGGKYFVPEIPDMSGVKKTGGDFNEKQLSEVMIDGRKTHNAAKVWAENCRGKPTLVYACTVAHAQALWEAFEAAGAKTKVLVGTTPKLERNQAILGLSCGALDAIISVGVLTTGVDIPALKAIICARPTESYNLWVQILGRGTRIFEGKTHFDVYDLAGNLITHGTIEDEKESYLNAEEAKKAKKEKTGKILAICQKCYATFEFTGQTECISCGAALVQLRKKKVGKRINTIGEHSDVKEYVKQEWEHYFDEVLKKAKDRGWKKGSIFFKMQEKYGESIAEKAFNKVRGRKWNVRNG